MKKTKTKTKTIDNAVIYACFQKKKGKKGRILRNALGQNRHVHPYPSNSAPNCCLPWYHNRVQMPKTKGKTKEKITKQKK